jgi:uncharacterized membrane protein YoaK (UPF0700 family)
LWSALLGVVSFPYVPVFIVLLVAYMVYSEWAGLDSRFVVVAAFVLLIVTAAAYAVGTIDLADSLAGFVVYLLAGGVVLVLVDEVRDGAPGRSRARWGSGVRSWQARSTDPSQERQGTPDQPFERSE